MHTYIPSLKVLSDNNPNLIAAIVGGVVGGLVGILLISLLGFGIAAVTLGLRKRGEYLPHALVIRRSYLAIMVHGMSLLK